MFHDGLTLSIDRFGIQDIGFPPERDVICFATLNKQLTPLLKDFLEDALQLSKRHARRRRASSGLAGVSEKNPAPNTNLVDCRLQPGQPGQTKVTNSRGVQAHYRIGKFCRRPFADPVVVVNTHSHNWQND